MTARAPLHRRASVAWLALLVVAVCFGGLVDGTRGARALGEGFFSLDLPAYAIQEGTALPVTVIRTNGTVLEQDVSVTVQLSEGVPDTDYPNSTITQIAVFPKGTNTTAKTLYFQTINKQRMIDVQVRVTITQVTIPNAIAYPSTAPIVIMGIGSPRVEDVFPRSANAGDWVDIRGRNYSQQGITCPPGDQWTILPWDPIQPATAHQWGPGLPWLDPSSGVPIPPPQPRCTVMVEFYPVHDPLHPVRVSPADMQVISPEYIRVRMPATLSDSWHDVRVTVRDPAAPAPPVNGFPPPYPKPTHYLSTSSSVLSDRFHTTTGPYIAQMSSPNGPVQGGALVRLFGKNFTAVMCQPGGVTFGGVSASSCTFVNSTQLDVVAPPHASGPVDVVVASAPGPSAYLSPPPATTPKTEDTVFTYFGGPQILALTPNAGPSQGGTQVVITGSGFAGILCGPGPTNAVKFGSTNAATCAVISDTEIRVSSPPGLGVAQVTVTHPVNGSSPFTTLANFTYASGPSINSLTPASGPPAGGTVVTIDGFNFAPGATVSFGQATSPKVEVISATQLTAVSPAGGGTVAVTVTIAGVTSPVTANTQFSYSSPGITELKPNAGPLAGANAIQVKGYNFTSTSIVAFGATIVPLTDVTFVDSTQLLVKVPKAIAPGGMEVKVTTPSGTTPQVAGVTLYTYTDGPIITNLNPKEGKTTGGEIVIITGTGFGATTAPVPTVAFGTVAALAVSRQSETQVTVLSPPIGLPGPVDVRVTTNVGTSPLAPEDVFTYKAANPVVTKIDPATGPTTGGTTITITGVGFTGVVCPDGVTFGAIKAASCTVTGDTSITAVSPSNVSGPTVIVVTSPNGQSEVAVNYTYVASTGTTPDPGPGPGTDGGGNTPLPPPSGAPVVYTLRFEWTLITWLGPQAVSVAAALQQAATTGQDITPRVAVIYTWDANNRIWRAYFTGSAGPPRASDFSTFERGRTYWIALTRGEPVMLATIDG
ncbi:MAG: IPT/TIG domain-containing protein [Dehalococcoidia bacterium]